MAGAVIDAVRERLRPSLILGPVVLLLGFRLLFDASLDQLGTMVAMLAVGGVTDVVSEAYDLRQSVKNASVGGIAVIGATAMLAFGDSAPLFPLVFYGIGGWFLLDAVQTIRHEGATERPRDGWEVYQTYVARRVYETVDERPRTRRELSEALDADDETVDAAIDDLRSRGVLVREGSELALSARDQPGPAARARAAAATVVGRIARPFRLEFDGGEPAVEDGPRDRSSAEAAHAERESRETDPNREYEPSTES